MAPAKKLSFLVLMCSCISCGTLNRSSSLLGEDELFITRKFAGIYEEYRHTGPDTFSGPNLIWIKTSMDKTLGKISAYGKKCDFSIGDRLYLKRTFYDLGGVSGYWEYDIENDSSQYYRVTEYQYDHKVFIQSWFK